MGYTEDFNNEIIQLFRENKTDKEISILLDCSTAHVRNIRKREGLPPSRGNFISPEIRSKIIQLIKEDKYYLSEISRLSGSNNATVRRIREQEIDNGNELPDFLKNEKSFVPIRQKYSDEELIELVKLNPGFGCHRFCVHLSITIPFVMELLDDYKNFFGEDLFSVLQDESFITMVTESEYRRITGRKYNPSGWGRSTATAGRKANRNSGQTMVPLPPQNFNWGKFEPRSF
tara:strand:+ start:160 stop:852 length:693 start_codon:yes stop_codon:yes gene_type:complete